MCPGAAPLSAMLISPSSSYHLPTTSSNLLHTLLLTIAITTADTEIREAPPGNLKRTILDHCLNTWQRIWSESSPSTRARQLRRWNSRQSPQSTTHSICVFRLPCVPQRSLPVCSDTDKASVQEYMHLHSTSYVSHGRRRIRTEVFPAASSVSYIHASVKYSRLFRYTCHARMRCIAVQADRGCRGSRMKMMSEV